MSKYAITWREYRLPTGKDFSVAVCGYSNKVCHMILGTDNIRRMFVHHVEVNYPDCEASGHCLAIDCHLNKTPRDHILHMFDLIEDEPLDSDTAKIWGTKSTVDCLIKFAKQITKGLLEENQRRSRGLLP